MKILREAKRFLNKKSSKAKLSNILTISHKINANGQTSGLKTAQGTSFISSSQGRPQGGHSFRYRQTIERKYKTQGDFQNQESSDKEFINGQNLSYSSQNTRNHEFGLDGHQKSSGSTFVNDSLINQSGHYQSGQWQNGEGREASVPLHNVGGGSKMYTSEFLSKSGFAGNSGAGGSMIAMNAGQAGRMEQQQQSQVASRVVTRTVVQKRVVRSVGPQELSPAQRKIILETSQLERSISGKKVAMPKIRLGCNYLKIMFQKQMKLAFYLMQQVRQNLNKGEPNQI
jgi:hypothetical protein